MTVAPIQRLHQPLPLDKDRSGALQENLMDLIVRIMLLAQQLSQHSTSKGERLRDSYKDCTTKIANHLRGRPVNHIVASYVLATVGAVAFGALHAGGLAASAVYQGGVSPATSVLCQTALGSIQLAFGHLANASQTALGARQEAQKAPLDGELALTQQRLTDLQNQGQSMGALTQNADQLAQTVAAMFSTAARGG